MKSFNLWCEAKDIFGFEKTLNVKNLQHSNSWPTHSGSTIIGELARLSLGLKESVCDYNTEVRWGNDTGSLKVKISPYGHYKIFIERLIHNLEGERVWVCERAYPLNKGKFAKSPDLSIAQDVYDELLQMDKEMIVMPSHEFEKFEQFVVSVGDKVRQIAPPVFVYAGVKKVSNDLFVVHLELKAAGVGGADQSRLNEFNVNLNFDKSTGLIRCWGNPIISPVGRNLWENGVSDWDIYFSPNQPKKLIEESICNCLIAFT